jgi:hypothetical protein
MMPTEPPHRERSAVVVVVFFDPRRTADFARLRHEKPAALIDVGVGAAIRSLPLLGKHG